MGLVHELHVVVIVSEVQGIVFKQLRKTVNTFCKIWLAVPKLYTQAHRTQHLEINHSHLCQIETLQSKPNNPLSKCHSDDKIAHTCIL